MLRFLNHVGAQICVSTIALGCWRIPVFLFLAIDFYFIYILILLLDGSCRFPFLEVSTEVLLSALLWWIESFV